MLLTLYLNDLPTVAKFSNMESYVDDTKIYLSCGSKDIHSCMQRAAEDLESIAGWCCANHLLINPDKTKLVLFGTRQLVSKLPDVTVPFLGQQLYKGGSRILKRGVNFCNNVREIKYYFNI